MKSKPPIMRNRILRHVTRWLFLPLVSVILGMAPPAQVERIDPGLLTLLKSALPTDQFRVMVRMADTVDYRLLRDSLQREGRRARHARLVQALREKARTSQESIAGDLEARVRSGRIRRLRRYWVINGFALTADARTIRELAERGDVEKIVPDRIVSLSQPVTTAAVASSWNLDMIGAPLLWQMGYTGQGMVVAELDSGVDINHPALSSKWRGGTNSWFDAVSSTPTAVPYDDNGHGTATMGVMVGGNTTDNRVGVAPGAAWIAAKIFDRQGNGSFSGIHAAFQWLLDPNGDGSAADAPDVVNCSWTISNPGIYNAEFAPDIEALATAGIPVVFAAGNSGPYGSTSVSPANNPGAIAVGATDSADLVTAASSRGPSAYDGSIYPLVTAPGSGIRTTDLTGGGNFPNSYTVLDGTSLAAPHVAGALALLRGINPNLTVSQLENGLVSSALDLGISGPDNSYGNGRIDLLQAAANLDLIPPHLPDGDVDGDGTVTVADALLALRASLGLQPRTAGLMYNGDVAPLVNGAPRPDRAMTADDAQLIFRKAVGELSW